MKGQGGQLQYNLTHSHVFWYLEMVYNYAYIPKRDTQNVQKIYIMVLNDRDRVN